MRTVGILGQAGWHAERLAGAFTRRGVETVLINPTSLTSRVQDRPRVAGRAGGEDSPVGATAPGSGPGPAPGSGGPPVAQPDENATPALEELEALLVRWLPGGTLEQVIYRVDVLHRLEHLGLPVVNGAEALERSVDKFLTSALLEDAGIPTPRTVVTEKAETALAAFREMGDAVLKPIFGSLGTGMVRLEDPEVAFRVFRTWEQMGYVFYLQEFIPHGTRDVRAFVLDGEVIAAMERVGVDWRTNVAKGARGRPFPLPPDLAELCRAAVRVVGLDYAGVDLLPADDGRWYVVEINGIPGWRGLEEATGRDVAAEMAGFLLQRVGASSKTRREGR